MNRSILASLLLAAMAACAPPGWAAGDLYAGMQLDLHKILGWDGWRFTLSGIDRRRWARCR